MVTAAELTTQLTTIRDNTVELRAKVDLLIEKINALQAGGGGATVEEINALAALASEIEGSVQATEDVVDSEVNEVP